MTSRYRIWPLRFSPRPERMIGFFADLGLTRVTDHENGTFAVFVGRSGSLGVHSSRDTAAGTVEGHTSLNFDTADLDVAAAELRAAGLQASVWDEAYGKQGAVLDPRGLVIGLNEDTQADRHGGDRSYHPAAADVVAASMDVMAVCFVDGVAAATDFFAHFGFRPDGAAEGADRVTLQAGRTDGLIGLHSRASATEPPRPGAEVRSGSEPPYTVALSFLTSEPLDALAARLQDAGHRATSIETDGEVRVDVVDPDGETIQVRPTR